MVSIPAQKPDAPTGSGLFPPSVPAVPAAASSLNDNAADGRAGGAPWGGGGAVGGEGAWGGAGRASMGGSEADGGAQDHLRLLGHQQPVLGLVLDAPGRRLYSASVDCSIKVWSLDDNSIVATVVGHKKAVTHMKLLGSYLYACGGRRVNVWHMPSMRLVHVIRISDECGTIRSLEVWGDTVFLGCQDTTVRAFHTTPAVWADSAMAGDEASPLMTQPPLLDSLGRRASSNSRGTPELLPARPGELAEASESLGRFPSEPVPQTDIAYETGAADGHAGAVNALVMWGGEHLASAGGDAMVRVWEVGSLALARVLRGHRGAILCLVSVGNLLVSGARDNTIRVWDMGMDMLCRRTLTGHKDDVTHLSVLTPRETVCGAHVHQQACSVIASASADGTVRLWSLTWMCLAVLTLPSGPASSHFPSAGGHHHHHPNWHYAASNGGGGGGPDAWVPPAALCCVMSRDAVLAGYADGEVRMWHVADLPSAALAAVTAELDAHSSDGAGGGDSGGGALGSPNWAACRTNSYIGQLGDVSWVAPAAAAAAAATVAVAAASVVTAVGATSRVQANEAVGEHVCTRSAFEAASAAETAVPGASRSAPPGAHGAGSAGSPPAAGCGLSPGGGATRVGSTMVASPAGGCSFSPSPGGGATRVGSTMSGVQAPLQDAPLMNLVKSSTDQQLEQCLREFVRIKTVSSNPAMREECLRGARFVSHLLEGLGAEVKVVRPLEDKNPVVLGRLGHGEGKPTITFYGHYDVQPANEPDWATDPFEMNAVNEYLYGRGTSDNKGPILAFIFAVRELLDGLSGQAASSRSSVAGSNGTAAAAASFQSGLRGLPFHIAFVFEGEEENGSLGFHEAVSRNLHWFAGTELVVISNTNWVGENVPCITYGMRGMVSMSIIVSGPSKDVHSGNDGGVFNEPMTDLIKVMGTVLAPGSSNVTVPGFSDDVAPGLLDLAWSSIQESGRGEEEFNLEGYRKALGVPALLSASGAPSTRELLEARWCKPTLSIVDMRTGIGGGGTGPDAGTHMRFGPTRFSVIPRTAVAKVSVRFVPNQDPAQIISAVHTHIESEFAKLGSQNTISVQVESCGSWWQAEQGSAAMKMVEGAVEREWGCRPMFVREGGTMPVARVLEELLGAPAIMVPMGQASDAPHLANERMRRTNLFRGRNVVRRLLEDLWRRHGGGDYPGGRPAGGCDGLDGEVLLAAELELAAVELSSTRPVTPPLFH
ncbi:hypothetical protein FOA52_004057 [Chlamydomonas sp. UWO 241]|nr:hypothetical protein FOA52_004057 [Chlamydomonas sp. UWO 241]